MDFFFFSLLLHLIIVISLSLFPFSCSSCHFCSCMPCIVAADSTSSPVSLLLPTSLHTVCVVCCCPRLCLSIFRFFDYSIMICTFCVSLFFFPDVDQGEEFCSLSVLLLPCIILCYVCSLRDRERDREMERWRKSVDTGSHPILCVLFFWYRMKHLSFPLSFTSCLSCFLLSCFLLSLDPCALFYFLFFSCTDSSLDFYKSF